MSNNTNNNNNNNNEKDENQVQRSKGSKVKGAKTSVNVEAGTKRRHEEAISIRSKYREAEMKRRRRDLEQEGGEEGGGDQQNQNYNQQGGGGNNNNHYVDPNEVMNPFAYNSKSPPSSIPLQLLPQFRDMLNAEDPNVVLHGALMIRKILAVRDNPPISDVISCGAVPDLIRLLGEQCDNVDLLFEACWAISNVASGSSADTKYVIELGAIPAILRHLSAEYEPLREQAAWAIGNFAGENVHVRDLLLTEFNTIPALLNCINMPTSKVSVTRNSVWAISNLTRHKPHPDLNLVQPALSVLASLLNHHDEDVVIDTLWTISYIGEGPPERIQAVVLSGVIAKVVTYLNDQNWMFQLPAIRIIGNLATGTLQQNQIVFNSGAPAAFPFLMNHPRRTIKKEVVWTIGNLLVGEESQTQQVFSTGVMPDVVRLMLDRDVMVRLEAVYAVTNACSRGTPEQVDFLVQQNLLANLIRLLNDPHPGVIVACFDCLNSLFQCGDEIRAAQNAPSNPYYVQFVAGGGLIKLEDLMEHPSQNVYRGAFALGMEHFPDAFDSEGSTGNAPQQQQQQQGGGGGGGGGNGGGGGGYDNVGQGGGNRFNF